MHGYIYEIRSKRTGRDEWANELNFSEDPNIDYASEVSDEERSAAIERMFDDPLIKELFERGDDLDTLILKDGGIDAVKREWYNTMRTELDSVQKENAIDISKLHNAMNNPPFGCHSLRYCLPDWGGDISEPGRELLWFASTEMPGTKFYICGVFDYHW